MPNLFTSIQKLQERLSDAGIPSVVIGGVAVVIWGDPRLTRDADLKTLLERKDADRLLAVLAPHYVSLLPDPREALRQAPAQIWAGRIRSQQPGERVVMELVLPGHGRLL